MEWTDAIQSAISFIEQHITDDITAEDVANHVHISSFYFQKGFSMLCLLYTSPSPRDRG